MKGEFIAVLARHVGERGAGLLLGGRMLLTNLGAGLSTEPDGMFLSYESLKARRIRLEEGEDSLEVQGSPDIVVEVVSRTSRQKDTVVLRDLYWRAGVREYWLAELRRDDLVFEILRYGSKGYNSARRQGRWVRSAVLGRSFTLTRSSSPVGLSKYSLEVQ